MSQAIIYELAVLYRPDFEADLEKVAAKVKKLVTANEGKILKEEVWGKRQLAYSIKAQTHAVYVFYDVEISGSNLAKIETSLNITEEVLRYQFHKPDLKAKEAYLAHQAVKAKKAKSTEAKADESKKKDEPEPEQRQEVEVKQDVS